MSLNYFKYIESISAGSPELLAAKLRMIPFAYQLQAVWSDGKEHFALINANRKLSVRLRERLAEVK